MIEVNRCYQGDCRDLLKQFAAAGLKVQTCVTSPPYWGLRDYGIEPSVWGGDAACVHDWGDEIAVHKGGNTGTTGTTSGLTNRGAHQERNAVKHYRAGVFCAKCHAWRGCLGLEPDYRMFIDHMVEVFALVWDVLADDGTLWLNLGDSYCSDGTAAPTTRAGPRVPSGWTSRAGAERVRPGRGIKAKDLCLMPARVAIALQEFGWYVRSDIIWHKPNPMPESCTDRPTKSHEYLFLLSKSERYYYDAEAIREPVSEETHARRAQWKDPDGWDTTKGQGGHGSIHKRGRDKGQKRPLPVIAPLGAKLEEAPTDVRASARMGRGAGWRKRNLAEANSGTKNNESFDAAMAVMPDDRNKRTVWTIATEAFPEAHFATFPRALIAPCILAGAPKGGLVLDLFMGSGTTAQEAEHLGRQWVGCEIQAEYFPMQQRRLSQRALPL